MQVLMIMSNGNVVIDYWPFEEKLSPSALGIGTLALNKMVIRGEGFRAIFARFWK